MTTPSDNPPVPKPLLEQMLDETFEGLARDDQFDQALLAKLKNLRANESLTKAAILAQIMPETT